MMDESGKVPKRLPENIIDRLVKTQYQNALNEAEQIKLRIRNIDHQADYAKKFLEYQTQVITSQPGEHRKTVTRYGYITVMILLVFLGFITTCLYIGKEEFIRYFLQMVSYIIVSVFSFYFGRKTSVRKDNGVKEAQVVDS